MTNPKHDPAGTSEATEANTPQMSLWRILPTIGSCGFGFASLMFGIVFVIGMANALLFDSSASAGGVIHLLAGCAMYFGFGVAWILAGWYYWDRRYRRGLFANCLGILVCIAGIGLLGP